MGTQTKNIKYGLMAGTIGESKLYLRHLLWGVLGSFGMRGFGWI